MHGADYSFSPHPSVAALKAAGVRFVGRYVSPDAGNDANGKNLQPGECKALLAAGISVIVYAEQYAARMREGHTAGAADARHADAVVKALGMPGLPVYFAADWDATPSDQNPINAYLDGAATVISHSRVGIYGGYWPVSRALDAKKAAYAVQTVAWSGGQWDPRAHVRQSLYVNVGGVQCDVLTSVKTDFGQWPRPAPPPVPQAGPRYLVADGAMSLLEAAHAHGTTVSQALWLMAADPERKAGPGQIAAAYLDAGDLTAPMPAGTRYWVAR